MAAGLSQLRKQAKQMRIPGALIREAETAEQLQSLIDTHASGGSKSGQKGKPAMAPAKKKKEIPAKKSTTKPVEKKSTRKAAGDKIALSAAKKKATKKDTTKKQTASKKPKAQASQNGDA